jgi:hypothetical protein
MMPVDVEIQPRSQQSEEINFIADVDSVVESAQCSCNAGDDNPY